MYARAATDNSSPGVVDREPAFRVLGLQLLQATLIKQLMHHLGA